MVSNITVFSISLDKKANSCPQQKIYIPLPWKVVWFDTFPSPENDSGNSSLASYFSLKTLVLKHPSPSEFPVSYPGMVFGC